MTTIELTLTQEEAEAIARYASAHGMSAEEAVKDAIFARIEEEKEALRAAIAKDLQNTQAGPTRLFEEELEEIRQN